MNGSLLLNGEDCLVAVEIDEVSIGFGSPEQAEERRTAARDLAENSSFAPANFRCGPYRMVVGFLDRRLVLDIRTAEGEAVVTHILSLSPFRALLKDYALMCESYDVALRTANPAQIEAIDMGRRGLHNEAATLLAERLAGKIAADFETMRRLFTLMAALHWKG